MDLLLSWPTNTDDNQPITNLKPRISASTTVISKKIKICTRRLLSQIYVIYTDWFNQQATHFAVGYRFRKRFQICLFVAGVS